MAGDNVDPEKDYFHKRDVEALAKLRAAQDMDAARKAAADLKELHFNRCGKCGHEMKAQAYKGVEIDVCTGCRAVLLDPGELEQLADKDKSFSLKDLIGIGRK